MMTTKIKKKIVVGIAVWQAIILMFTLFTMAISYEPLTFLSVYFSVMWILTVVVVLFSVVGFGLVYLLDE